MSQKKYTITVTEEQLRTIRVACEWYERTLMGQFFDLCTEISFMRSHEREQPDFDTKITRRNSAQDMMDRAYRIMLPLGAEQKTDVMMIAEDLWTSIRHFLWLQEPEPKSHIGNDAFPPLLLSGQPAPEIRRADT